uniref:Cytochrome b6/f complex subunit V n=1 Tax=Cumathamnion serrulatum TaxID=1206573 RepID=A0A7U1AR87_9FLOR|nr:cytochrome b6/f complex subunit V [Cumathamnion serrulatum]QQY85408.1 cytochrome b6/f complex subunit V [Cumathamnion serrulatum]
MFRVLQELINHISAIEFISQTDFLYDIASKLQLINLIMLQELNLIRFQIKEVQPYFYIDNVDYE